MISATSITGGTTPLVLQQVPLDSEKAGFEIRGPWFGPSGCFLLFRLYFLFSSATSIQCHTWSTTAVWPNSTAVYNVYTLQMMLLSIGWCSDALRHIQCKHTKQNSFVAFPVAARSE